ncbi:MAG: peptidoglycan DD-metalloendopeptidase family protein [Pseudomonadota bacterium]
MAYFKGNISRIGRCVVLITPLWLGACLDNFDVDLRGNVGALDTSNAAQQAAIGNRPQADTRGIITYSDYQVAVARAGDTVTTVANRMGLPATRLAEHNGLTADAALRDGEILVLPQQVMTVNGGPPTPTIVDISELGGGEATPMGEPIRHRVEPGETAFTVARLYNVPVQALQQWNGLAQDLSLREGQILLIPASQNTSDTSLTPVVSVPGVGSVAPNPPSSTRAQPREDAVAASQAAAPSAPAPVVDLGPTTQASAAPASVLLRPINGSTIRSYKKGSNDGIDIGAVAGTTVMAADGGRVAAISKDTNGVNLLVLQHANKLLTVYTNVDNITVAKGDTVTRGQSIAKVAAGNPSFLHFEVRRGLDSLDPEEFL